MTGVPTETPEVLGVSELLDLPLKTNIAPTPAAAAKPAMMSHFFLLWEPESGEALVIEIAGSSRTAELAGSACWTGDTVSGSATVPGAGALFDETGGNTIATGRAAGANDAIVGRNAVVAAIAGEVPADPEG